MLYDMISTQLKVVKHSNNLLQQFVEIPQHITK